MLTLKHITLKIKTMSDFKIRLLEERDQLLERTNKLDAFLDSDTFENISEFQANLLLLQYDHMCDYLECLNLRIEDLENNWVKELNNIKIPEDFLDSL